MRTQLTTTQLAKRPSKEPLGLGVSESGSTLAVQMKDRIGGVVDNRAGKAKFSFQPYRKSLSRLRVHLGHIGSRARHCPM